MKIPFVIKFIFIFLLVPIILYSSEIKNVILISIDTWRYDYFSFLYPENVHTPNIDFFAKRSIVFRNAFSTVPLTAPAHASILTGQYPFKTNLRDNFGLKINEEIKTIAEVLKSKSFITYGFVSSSTVSSDYGFSRGFDIFNDLMPLNSPQSMEPRSRDATSTLKEVLNNFKWDKPFFLFLHFFDPHYPYNPPSKFKEYYPKNFYAGEVSYVDETLGNFFRELEKRYLFDNSIIVLTADHGEALGEHKEKTHGYLTYNSTLKVPLILYFPGCQQKISDYPVSHIDIFPTILDLLKIKDDYNLPGISLLNNQKREIYFESFFSYNNYGLSKINGIIDGSFKLIIKEKSELYDIIKDPKELKPIKNKEIEKKLKDKFVAKFNIEASESNLVDKEKIKNLKSLGYFGAADLNIKGDPSLLIEDIQKVDEARELYFKKDFLKAKEFYLKLLKIFPLSSILHNEIGVVYVELNDLKEAEKSFKRSMSLNPNNIEAIIHLANLFQEKGNLEDSFNLYEKALRLSPTHPEALFNYATACIKANKFEKAREIFKYYIEIYPMDPEREKIIKFLKNN